MLKNIFENWITKLWYKKRLHYLLWVLYPLSFTYLFLFKLKKKLIVSEKLIKPTIVIGNLTVGGTGKTPFALELSKHLRQLSYKVGIVTRGYKNTLHLSQKPYRIGYQDNADKVGDESYLLFSSLNKLNTSDDSVIKKISDEIPVVIDHKRVRGAKTLIDHECECIICDDGLQHFSLSPDISILIIDGIRLFGNGYCIPAGPLRENIGDLSRFDLLIVRIDEPTSVQSMEIINDFISSIKKINPNTFIMRVSHNKIVDLYSKEIYDIKKWKEKYKDFIDKGQVNALAGIGNPDRFFLQLGGEGIQTNNISFPDHYKYNKSDLDSFNSVVLMTQKDAVKCFHLIDKSETYFYVNLKIDLDRGVWEYIYSKLSFMK